MSGLGAGALVWAALQPVLKVILLCGVGAVCVRLVSSRRRAAAAAPAAAPSRHLAPKPRPSGEPVRGDDPARGFEGRASRWTHVGQCGGVPPFPPQRLPGSQPSPELRTVGNGRCGRAG
eukprot:362388-Chlamydomonas_euryale.AAC.10